jgi:hypothetical protein
MGVLGHRRKHTSHKAKSKEQRAKNKAKARIKEQ